MCICVLTCVGLTLHRLANTDVIHVLTCFPKIIMENLAFPEDYTELELDNSRITLAPQLATRVGDNSLERALTKHFK